MKLSLLMSCLIVSRFCFMFNVYCHECPPGGTIGHPGGQHKKFLPFGHGRDLWHLMVPAYRTSLSGVGPR